MLLTINIVPLRKPVYIQYYQVNVNTFLDITHYQLGAATSMFFEDSTPLEKPFASHMPKAHAHMTGKQCG